LNGLLNVTDSCFFEMKLRRGLGRIDRRSQRECTGAGKPRRAQ
jgi:hypothetical protein